VLDLSIFSFSVWVNFDDDSGIVAVYVLRDLTSFFYLSNGRTVYILRMLISNPRIRSGQLVFRSVQLGDEDCISLMFSIRCFGRNSLRGCNS
jgi:hypothetical protein